MHVVRSPYARAAAAIEATPGTVEVLHAVAEGRSRGPCDSGRFFRGVRPGSTPRKNLPARAEGARGVLNAIDPIFRDY